MGASEWIYYVPYQENIEQAFYALRQQVFEIKEYHNWGEVLEYEEVKESLCVERGIESWNEEAVKKMLQEVGPIQISEARTIEELLAKPDDGQGTHSILDITSFSPQYEEYSVKRRMMPFSKKILMQFFGLEKPTKERVERVFAQRKIWNVIHPWMGYYAVIYHNALPCEIVFAGCSGD